MTLIFCDPYFLPLKYIRICHANTAIHYQGAIGAEVTDTARHIQLLDCALGIKSEGTASYSRVLSLGNILMSHVDQAIGGSRFRGRAEHLTVDTCTTLARDDAPNSRALYFANSVFANLASLGSGLSLDGSNNGFYPQTTHQLGSGEIFETASLFAPTTFIDPQLGELPNPENGQGAYYLRQGSPFFDVGTPNVDATLKSELAQMTAAVPPQFLWQDLTSSQTLGPQPIRDQGDLDLGWHYPAVDYVISGATVNNCTLNIDSGTVLAFVGYWPWGLRVNAGGRLNVNGLPTNHVVFAQLAAVQESPISDISPIGPMLTFRDVFFGQRDTPATPLPEARLRFAEFPTISGGFDPASLPGCNLSVGPLASIGYFALPDYANHGTLGNLEVNGCVFQGGEFYYEAGGPQGRTVGVTNSVFERCIVSFMTSYGYGQYTHVTEYDPQLAAVNNLWYDSYMKLVPVGSDNTWIFTENIFDGITFDSYWDLIYNGPIGHNDHNAYVAMSGNHLAPIQNSGSDPDLTALPYQGGPLGRFYLPQDNLLLINKGPRSAGLAGLYHFTTSSANAKEAASTVDIGPHYLALDASGNPFDSNAGGPDGIPDFIADRNGDGSEIGETPWSGQNAGGLAILSPADGSTVSGIITVRFNPGADATAMAMVFPYVDGQAPPESASVINPGTSLTGLEFDTRYLPDGTHNLVLWSQQGGALGEKSQMVAINTVNEMRYPGWARVAEGALEANLTIPSPVPPSVYDFTLSFYRSSYAKSYEPTPAFQYHGTTSDGSIAYSALLSSLGIGDGTADPQIYVVADAPAAPPTARLPGILPGMYQSAGFPQQGRWVVSYTDDYVDYNAVPSDGHNGPVLDPTDAEGSTSRFCHDHKLRAWVGCGAAQDQSFPTMGVNVGIPNQQVVNPFTGTVTDGNNSNPDPVYGQTLPLRVNNPGHQVSTGSFGQADQRDWNTLLACLMSPDTVNFFGAGHGLGTMFMGALNQGVGWGQLHHRFRFVFLDGCHTASGGLLERAFGADPKELGSDTPLDVSSYTDPTTNPNKRLRPGAFLAWKSDTKIRYEMGDYYPDPTTHQSCWWRDYEIYSEWHGQVVANWANNGKTIWQSIRDANTSVVAAPASYPRWAGANPGWTTQVLMPDGTKGFFKPDTCLKFAGFGGLRFSGVDSYNKKQDW